MPELPDITIYVEALRDRMVGRPIVGIRMVSSFFLRTYDPSIESIENESILRVHRMGKRIVFSLSSDLHLIVHLMIAGRFVWKTGDSTTSPRTALAVFRLSHGMLQITETGKKKRASLHLIRGNEELRRHDRGGLEIMNAEVDSFRAALVRENRTLKRALTDPSTISGIGNAYSDEILHAAGLSPFLRTGRLSPTQFERLFRAARDTLHHWTETLRRQFGGRFPSPREITAFREGFAVHGKYGNPCPTCQSTVQRVRFAERETNYCPGCQTNGRILSDRSLARLLGPDWAKSA